MLSGAEYLLLVDDDQLICRAWARQLEPGVTVRQAHTVAEARFVLKRYKNVIGALLDLILPDGTALDVVASLHDVHSRLPILVATATEPPLNIQRKIQASGSMFAPKPLGEENFDGLLRFIKLGEDPMRKVRRYLVAHRVTRRQREAIETVLVCPHHATAAKQLGITPGSFSALLQSGLRKCGVRGIPQLLVAILRET